MKLTLRDIENITFGALKVEERTGEFYFHRFTEKQVKFYEETNEAFALKALSTASVLLDFSTDSETLFFSYKALPGTCKQRYCCFDIYENDCMIHHLGEENTVLLEGEENTELLEGEVKLSLSKGEKRIRIYLPNLYIGSLSDIALDDGASLTPTEKKIKVFTVGDSITQGYHALYPSLSYVNIMAEECGFSLVNQAIGGEIFNPGILPAGFSVDADLVTIAYGTNDWSKTPTLDEICKNAEAYFKRLKAVAPAAKLIYISPIWRADSEHMKKAGSFFDTVEAIKSIAIKAGAEVICGYNLIPHDKGVFTDARLHPDDLGFTQYARNLVKELHKLGIEKK